MAAAQLQGVILTAMHNAPVQSAQLQGVILTAMHNAPAAAQLQGVILTAMHNAPAVVVFDVVATIGKRAIWLLNLDIGGRVYRFASESVVVFDAAGIAYSYESGLAPLSLGLDDGSASKSVSVTLTTDVDWALLASQGHALELQLGTLRRWFRGQALERATVVVVGLTEGAQYGARQDPMTVAIVRSAYRDSRPMLDAQAVVDGQTFPRPVTGYSISDKAAGASYPLIIGAPGHDPRANQPRAAVPALAADFQFGLSDSTLVIADRRIAAVTVMLENTTLHSFATAVPVQRRLDELGREYSYVDFTTAVSQLGGEGDEYYVGFQDDAVFGGGSIHRGKMVRGAGDVIRFILEEHSDIRYDRGRLEAVIDWLNQYKIDSYINLATEEAWPWIEREILRWLQVVVVEGQEGLYLRPMNYAATTTDARMWLSTDRPLRNVKRDGLLTTIREDIFNEFTFEYRKQREASKYFERRILSAEPKSLTGYDGFLGAVADERIFAHYLCKRSQADYGIRPWRGASGSIWDDATAGLILNGMAERFTFRKRAARYSGGGELEALERGDIVVLTDPPVHLDEVLAIVDNRLVSGDEVALDLIIIDHPVQR